MRTTHPLALSPTDSERTEWCLWLQVSSSRRSTFSGLFAARSSRIAATSTILAAAEERDGALTAVRRIRDFRVPEAQIATVMFWRPTCLLGREAFWYIQLTVIRRILRHKVELSEVRIRRWTGASLSIRLVVYPGRRGNQSA
jgi:hypothetical protein